MKGLRVINLGLPKSGTTTLARALRRAGMRVADHRIRPAQTDDATLHGAYVGDLVYRGYFTTGDPGAFLTGFDAISEMSMLSAGRSLWPQTDFGIIDALRGQHPGVRFVATRRPSEAVSRSIAAWSNLGTERLPRGQIPGLPAGYGGTDTARIRWIDAHYRHLARIFAGAPDYLELDVSRPGARARLGAFLDMRLPWWGKANSNRRARAAAAERTGDGKRTDPA